MMPAKSYIYIIIYIYTHNFEYAKVCVHIFHLMYIRHICRVFDRFARIVVTLLVD